MKAIKLTNKQNEEVFINLNSVASFSKNGCGTTVEYDNGELLEVKESFSIVEYLLDHYVFEVGFDNEAD